MKLIMENWRRYVTENNNNDVLGYLYLFEGTTPRRHSFVDALEQLNENDIEKFLTEWEQSVDYQLSEGAVQELMDNPIMYLSHQAFMLLDRVKEKAAKFASKIMGVVNKIRAFAERYEEKHPTLYRIGVIATKVITAILIVLALTAIFSGDAQAADLVKFDAGDPTSNLIASSAQLEKLGTALQNSSDPLFQEVSTQMLEIASSAENVTPSELGPIKQEFMEILNTGLGELRAIEEAKELAAKATEAAQNITDIARAGEVGPTEVIGMLTNSAQAGQQEALTQLQQLASQGASEEIKELAKAALESLQP